MTRVLLASLLLFACKSPPPARAPEPLPPVAPQDRDGDGYIDGKDACPNVQGIAPDGCPEKDRDGDGLLDRADKCPDDPGVEPEGCPIPDSDGDGILDPGDTCLNEVETKNGYLDDDGCPDEIPEDLAAITGIIKGVQFEFDKDVLKRGSFAPLDRAVQVLKRYPQVRIEISSHTGPTEDVSHSYSPAIHRSRAVEKYLVEHGLDEARIETRDAGPDEPIDTNKTAAGRAKNRRIEFTILIQ